MGFRLSDLNAVVSVNTTDIFHLRTTGGLDKKITATNLFKNVISSTINTGTLTVTGQTILAQTSGAVGIGTSSPDQLLSLNNTSGNLLQSFRQSDVTKGYIGVSGSANGIMLGSVSGDLVIRAETQKILLGTAGSGAATMILATSGNVLIGTTTDNGEKLQVVNSTGSTSIRVESQASGGLAQLGLFSTNITSSRTEIVMKQGLSSNYWNCGIDGDGTYKIANNVSGNMATNVRMAINGSSGNVLIGTTTDVSRKLHVAGSVAITGTTLEYRDNNLEIISNSSDGSDNRVVSIGGGGGVTNTRGAFASFFGNEHSVDPGDLKLYSGITGHIYLNPTGAGNVLIGTTTDTGIRLKATNSLTANYVTSLTNTHLTGYGLYVAAGSVTGDYALRVQNYNTTLDIFQARGNGNILIGSDTDSGGRLQVTHTYTGNYAGTFTNTHASGYGLFVKAASGTNAAMLVQDYLGNPRFQVSGNGDVKVSDSLRVENETTLIGKLTSTATATVTDASLAGTVNLENGVRYNLVIKVPATGSGTVNIARVFGGTLVGDLYYTTGSNFNIVLENMLASTFSMYSNITGVTYSYSKY